MKLEFDTGERPGIRATLGVIVLETDETLEPEFARMMNMKDVALYHSRIPMASDVRTETLGRMERDIPASAQLFPSPIDFDVIGYGCTSASTVIGSQNVAHAIQSVFPKVQVTNPLDAIIAAGKSLEVKRLGFITPYVPEVSKQMRQKLEDADFEIAAFGSFEESDDATVARITESSIIAAAKHVAQLSACDAIVISCTSLRCLSIIPEIEKDIGIPVISSNQALGWHMLRLGGIHDVLPKFGRLFAKQLCA